jgi:hypothetical protein
MTGTSVVLLHFLIDSVRSFGGIIIPYILAKAIKSCMLWRKLIFHLDFASVQTPISLGVNVGHKKYVEPHDNVTRNILLH